MNDTLVAPVELIGSNFYTFQRRILWWSEKLKKKKQQEDFGSFLRKEISVKKKIHVETHQISKEILTQLIFLPSLLQKSYIKKKQRWTKVTLKQCKEINQREK